MNESVAIILTFLTVWLVGWLFFAWVFARISGWTTLAKNYLASDRISGKWWYFQSALMKPGFGFRATLNICANLEGLYISSYFPLNFFQPPVFIPWNNIRGSEVKGRLRNWVELRFEKTPSIPFTINTWLANEFEKNLEDAWHYTRLKSANK